MKHVELQKRRYDDDMETVKNEPQEMVRRARFNDILWTELFKEFFDSLGAHLSIGIGQIAERDDSSSLRSCFSTSTIGCGYASWKVSSKAD